MPSKIQIKKEQILDCAVQMVREKGMKGLNARNLSKALGCSVHPIFRAFANMEDLKENVFAVIAENYQEYLAESMSGEDPLQNLLLAYIRYAQNEKECFKLLHMSDRLGLHETAEFTGVGINKIIVEAMAGETGLSIKDAETLYTGTFFTAHGIASMLAMNHCSFSEETITNLLAEVFDGMVMKLKTQAK